MKNFTFLAFLSFSLLCATLSSAQNTESGNVKTPTPDVFQRCATMENIEKRLQTDPEYKANYERGLRDFEGSQQGQTSRVGNTDLLTAPVTIPVVVHIVLPNPNLVTDADVQNFLNRLNLDFSGFNPDSTNGATWYGVRGHSLLRFVMARRDPNGNLTNGIERKVGNITFGSTQPEPIKSTAAGGLNPWPHTQYYNLWIGQGFSDASGTILGIAPEIGPGTAANDGVIVDYRVFAGNPCYTVPAFNLGRTAVHEIGHNFGLYHIFQDGCANGDFRQLTSPGVALPANLLAPSDDTPAQSAPTSGCPTGTQPTGCPAFPNPPGKMYQNYMDYTNDACYSMFSKGQVERMHYVLEIMRPGYLTTLGATPPANAITLDAFPLESVNPGGSEVIGCVPITYSATRLSCAGGFAPKFRVKNNGLTIMTSVIAGYRLDNGAAVTTGPITVNLISGATTVVTLPPTTNLTAGVHQFKFFTAQPNGSADQAPANDTLTVSFTVIDPASGPIVEGFEVLPVQGWSVFNPNNNNTWTIVTPGRNSARSAFINNFSFNVRRQIDDLRSPTISTSGADSLFLTFDLAHKNYTGSNDTLTVLVSNDCGNTYTTTTYKKWGATLATAGPSTASYTNPAEGDWRTERIAIGGTALLTGNATIAFRNTNDFGNNIFIDNVNISVLPKRDLQLVSINQPSSIICSPNFTPSATVRNVGNEIITAFKVSYSIDNSAPQTTTITGVSLPRNRDTTVSLPAATVGIGAHTIRVYSWEPVTGSGTGDLNTRNDTLSRIFSLVSTVAAPLREGFENTTFPPPGWAVVNPDFPSFTWQRAPIGKLSTGSAYVNNYNYPVNNQVDDLVTPQVTYNGVDSVRLKFDVAAVTYSYPGSAAIPLDTLEVLVTTNCGNTYTSVYKKWGADLQTVGDPNSPQTDEFTPNAPSHWRTDSVDLTSFANQPGLQVIFRNKSNFENNIYVDNIALTTRTLPAKLKQQGYLVLPTVTQDRFSIWHYQQPTTLRFVTVHSSGGHLIYKKQYSRNAERFITVDLSSQPSGVYFVTVGYEDEYRNVTERVIKR